MSAGVMMTNIMLSRRPPTCRRRAGSACVGVRDLPGEDLGVGGRRDALLADGTELRASRGEPPGQVVRSKTEPRRHLGERSRHVQDVAAFEVTGRGHVIVGKDRRGFRRLEHGANLRRRPQEEASFLPLAIGIGGAVGIGNLGAPEKPPWTTSKAAAQRSTAVCSTAAPGSSDPGVPAACRRTCSTIRVAWVRVSSGWAVNASRKRWSSVRKPSRSPRMPSRGGK
jgi:hypothetical protein